MEGDLDTSRLRVGIGHDTHRLRPGGPLRLGGVDVVCDWEAIGHSDADCLLHAVTDALLGAACLGDIGQMFPDTEPAHRLRDSAEMLRLVLDAVYQSGWRIGNVDGIIFLERPKLGPSKQAIRNRIAQILEIDSDHVSVKAKTGEGIGPIGRHEVVAAECVVLLERHCE